MFQASHRKLAYVVCGQNRRRLLEASMGWYIRHHWHGMVWYGMARYGKIWHGMARYGMRGHIRHHCQDNVSHRYWGSVSGENGCLNLKGFGNTMFWQSALQKLPMQCDKMVTFLEILKVLQLRSDPSIEHVFAQTFFHLSLATQFGRHSWQGVGKGLEHRHWLPGARGARGALLIAQLNWLVNFAFLYLLTIEAQSH